jgi:hypothetical protein
MCDAKSISVAASLFLLWMALLEISVDHSAAAESHAPEQRSAAAQENVLLLGDGGVLTGVISKSDDRYLVVRGGAEISVPSASVVAVCDSLEAAYRHQQCAMQGPEADAHMALAEWCLRNGLYRECAAELAAVRAVGPKHPRMELLERRLDVVGRSAPPLASGTQETKTSAVSSVESAAAVSAVGDLPSGVVERFTRKVQPLLVNNCTLAGCHRPGGEQSFVLDRALLHGMGNRRSTMNNLSAVLALVDHERPQESPLLVIPRRDHGGMNRPIFGPRQSSQLQQLVDWVGLVTKTATSTVEAPAPDGGDPAPPAVQPAKQPPGREPIEQAAYEKAGKIHLLRHSKAAAMRSVDDRVGHVLDSEEVLPPLAPARLQYGARTRSWEPKDPFDPEIFNRQSQRRSERNSSETSQD